MPWPPDPLTPDQPADLIAGDSRVGDDRQQIVQQRLVVLPRLAPLGPRVTHHAFSFALLRRDGLVKQLHDLVLPGAVTPAAR